MASVPRTHRRTFAKALFLSLLPIACLTVPSHVAASPLVPETKFRLTVVQWAPAKGEYLKWDAVGGDFTVSPGGAVMLPLIGAMNVSGLDETAIAAEIARRLKDKLGLVALPDATIAVLEFPPVYVVGWVNTPGSFAFRDGLTVLQAVALSGGTYRTASQESAPSQINLLGDLKRVRSEILYALGRQARLEAEQEGLAKIAFPPELTDNPDHHLTAAIVQQEELILATRMGSLKRQLTSLSELETLFAAEIDALEQKGDALERGLDALQKELTGVEGLVNRGVATVSRRSELERAVAGMQAQRLDQVTAIMRARQNSNEAARNALTLQDQRRIEIASGLQEAQTNLEVLRTRREVAERLLMESPAMDGQEIDNVIAPEPRFTIVRKSGDRYDETPATELSVLVPGDVVKVTAGTPGTPGSDPLPTADAAIGAPEAPPAVPSALQARAFNPRAVRIE